MSLGALAMPSGARGFGLGEPAVLLVVPVRPAQPISFVPQDERVLTGLVALTRAEAEALAGELAAALAAFAVGQEFTAAAGSPG